MGNNRVLVTGSRGMIGSKVVELLPSWGYHPITLPDQLDLRNLTETLEVFLSISPNYVINCAGFNGGIGFNKSNPAEIYKTNSEIISNVIDCSKLVEVKKLVGIITSCAFPAVAQNPLKESDLHNGPPDPSVECHAYARRVTDIMSRQYHKQYGCNFVNVILNNCYGPCDRFSPQRSKFMAALIKKFCDAKREGVHEVSLWGSGIARRELLYRDDAAVAIITALEEYDDPSVPLNMGCGEDHSIKEYAEIVAATVGYEGQIIWDTSKPEGQLRKLLDVDRMRKLTTFSPVYNIHIGTETTVAWYNKNHHELTR